MHDVAYFESRGIPSTAILSTQFQAQAKFQAAGLGLSQVTGLCKYVAHPISDQTVTQMHDKGVAVFADVTTALLEGPKEELNVVASGAPPTDAEDCVA